MTVEFPVLPEHLPERLAVEPSSVFPAEAAAGYRPAASGGWELIPGALEVYRDHRAAMLALEAEHQAKIAESRERIRQAEEQIKQIVIGRATREALMRGGVDMGLLTGAEALFLQEVALKMLPDHTVVVDEPGSVAGVEFAAATWLAGPGKAYREKQPDPGPGELTRQLRELWH